MRVSDPAYQLPSVFALQPHDFLPDSANTPQLVRCIDSNTQLKEDYVIKYIRAQRMSPEASARELLASFIALEWEMPIPEPSLINITPEFIELLRGSPFYEIASQSIGVNFGCKYLSGPIILDPDQSLNLKQTIFAKDILFFDIFIQTSDRTRVKPNMLTNGEVIYMIDHETSFGFSLELEFLRNKNPWIIRPQDMNWINQHILFHKLKGKSFDYDKYMNKLELLNENFWHKSETLIPNNWKSSFNEIKNFLSLIIEHRIEFINNLKIILA